MNEGWLELESDPGLFTLLVEEFGVKGVQVEEIYDLQKAIEGPVYGFIFLFKWIEERRARRKMQPSFSEVPVGDDSIINNMFFAQQIVPNSCATHALLSILLNCSNLSLGQMLTQFKDYTRNFSPENKGYTIGNMPDLAKIHNRHAKPEPRHLTEKQTGVTSGRTKETFHFVSYLPIGDRLYELDGLKPYPIDHGLISDKEDWTEKFRKVISERLDSGGCDIRFNLMAVVGDRRQAYEQKLITLGTNRQIILEALQQLVRATQPHVTSQRSPGRGHSPRGGSTRHTPTAKVEQPSQQVSQKSNVGTEHKKSSSRKKMKKKKLEKEKPVIIPLVYKLPAALDSHNYAKSPMSETTQTDSDEIECLEDTDSDNSDLESRPTNTSTPMIVLEHSHPKVHPHDHLLTLATSDKSIKMETERKVPSVTFKIEQDSKQQSDESGNLLKPLSVQTSFSQNVPSPSSSNYSTDTASEVGSAFNSPLRSTNHSRSCSPDSLKVIKFQQWKVGVSQEAYHQSTSAKLFGSSLTKDAEDPRKIDELKRLAAALDDTHFTDKKSVLQLHSEAVTKAKLLDTRSSDCESGKKPMPSPSSPASYPFSPKDLLALLKNVEAEITATEQNLKDELEKRKKYKIDDARRVHNYDPFICTFLSMLAEQNKLQSLVEQHTLVKKRQGCSLGRLHKTRKDRRRQRSKKKRYRELLLYRAMDGYDKVKVVGKGSYGEVWLVKHKKDKKNYVVKKLELRNASKKERVAAEQEAKLLSKLRHPNIVSYKDSFESDDGHLYIAMGYCDGGDLYNKLKEQKGAALEEKQIVEWFVQIAMALQYMHERNILHRDLKTQNIFLTKSKIIKVGDLGIARVLDSCNDMATTLIGTPYYMSPELFSNKPYNHKSDVWALGCCVYEMTTLKHAFNAKDMNSLVYKILRGKMPAMPKQYSCELIDLIKSMLHQTPDKRPTVARILRNQFIKKHIALFLESTRARRPNSGGSESHRRSSRTEVVVKIQESETPRDAESKKLKAAKKRQASGSKERKEKESFDIAPPRSGSGDQSRARQGRPLPPAPSKAGTPRKSSSSKSKIAVQNSKSSKKSTSSSSSSSVSSSIEKSSSPRSPELRKSVNTTARERRRAEKQRESQELDAPLSHRRRASDAKGKDSIDGGEFKKPVEKTKSDPVRVIDKKTPKDDDSSSDDVEEDGKHREEKEINKMSNLLECTLNLVDQDVDDRDSPDASVLPTPSDNLDFTMDIPIPAAAPKAPKGIGNDTMTSSGRLMDRIGLLRKDVINGIGLNALMTAYEILDEYDEDQVELKLTDLLGKSKFDIYGGKIWQLKFCEETVFG
ncbi:ubiquitin carboxyl-terminal hydrolase BAP1-like [Antedon mediterranea]|uniref:ubiquitin carboxyl-terminal hydrolase BAP1-like n=1 Tax=Antedon mediterranea TaxID=105859 RepID=UPI003AF7DBEB